jgi:hypothetical protein
VFTWGVLVALVSIPVSMLSWALAGYLVWRNGAHDLWARTAGAFALAALLSTGLIGWRMVEARRSAEPALPRNGLMNVGCEGAA